MGPVPIAIPVSVRVRVHKKHDQISKNCHATVMLIEIAGWFPNKFFHICADGVPFMQLTGQVMRTEP